MKTYKTIHNPKGILLLLTLSGLIMVLVLPLSSAVCYDSSRDYGDARAYSKVCGDFSNYPYSDGDFIDFSCSSDDQWLYFGVDQSCNENGCSGMLVSNPYRYYLSQEDQTRKIGVTFDKYSGIYTLAEKVNVTKQKIVQFPKIVQVAKNITSSSPVWNVTDYKTIDYAGVIALQTKKIQELESQINCMKSSKDFTAMKLC